MSSVKIFTPSVFKDKRGELWTSWKKSYFNGMKFNHDKFSVSKKNVLRGLHLDFKSWKMVSCISGKIFFVTLNFNKKSKNYLNHNTYILSEKNKKILLIPPNFANGLLCISDKCLFHYKFFYKGKYADVKNQVTIKWDDPKLNIKWPIKNPILSKADKKAKKL